MALAEDEARRGLERQLHDGTQQDLVALAVNLQLARQLVERDPDAAAALLDGLRADVQRALEETTRLAHRIYPPLLETGGLGAALRAAATASGVPTEISVATPRLEPETAGAVYFCWLAILDGATDGQRAGIAVDTDGDAVTFEVSSTLSTPSEALVRMRDRVNALGGRLTIESRPDGKTSACGWIPLSR